MRHIKSILAIAAMVGALFSLSSCSETDDTVEEYVDWKNKNEAYFTSKYNAVKQAIAAGDKSWKIIKCFARDASTIGQPTDYILVKVIRSGEGSGPPLYTDSVRVHYRGQLIASATHVDSKDKELGYVFDTSWNTDTFNEEISVPVKYGVSSLCDGFSTALQNMRIGDRWLVYMPYELGYGTTDYGVIPAYSTLVFDMALAAFYRVGTTVPQWSSNEGFLWEENY